MTPKSIVCLSGTILVLFFVLLKFVPVPGYGAGVLEPVGNWGNYIDQHFLAGRMQHGTWEGKSLLGSFPALVTMLMGLLAGIHLRTARPAYEKLRTGTSTAASAWRPASCGACGFPSTRTCGPAHWCC